MSNGIKNPGTSGLYFKCTLYAPSKTYDIDISNLISAKIIERMDFMFYTGTIEFIDPYDSIEHFKFNGAEKISIDIGESPEDFVHYDMIVWNWSHVHLLNDQSMGTKGIRINLISEANRSNNWKTYVWKGKADHDRVNEIAGDLGLGTDLHNCIATPYEEDGCYVLPNINQQRALYHVRKTATCAETGTNDYMIWQCHKNKLNFKSISALKNQGISEEFYEVIEKGAPKKENQMLKFAAFEIDPGMTHYSSHKNLTVGYDYDNTEYIKTTNTMKDVFASKMESGGYPIVEKVNDKVNSMPTNYFLYNDDLVNSFSKYNLFVKHVRLFIGEFTTMFSSKRKVGDKIKMNMDSHIEGAESHKLFHGTGLIFGITHFISYQHYHQKLNVYKDVYTYTSKDLVK